MLGVLLGRNAWLFSVPEYEDADMGAYSIQVEQARRFALLVGNYSREHFNHPGPAFLYVLAAGESVFYDFLHLVPAAWNGQIIGLYLLNSFFAAGVVAAGWRWGGTPGAAVSLGVVALYGGLHPDVFSSSWMPYEYGPAYFAFVVSLASVAAGRARDAWLATLSGWFLLHGHACFLFIVPALILGALAPAIGRRVRQIRRVRRTRARSARAARAEIRRVWRPVWLISVVFALPVAVELALHWPGNFAKYAGYSGSASAGGHGAAQVADYVLWFWWPHPGAAAVAVALMAAALAALWRTPAGSRLRRFCAALLAVGALSTVAFACYAAAGVDELNQYYIGYFYWPAPLVPVLVIALSLVSARPPGLLTAVLSAAAVTGACVAFAAAPHTRLTLDRADPVNRATGPVTDPGLPAGVAAIARLSTAPPAPSPTPGCPRGSQRSRGWPPDGTRSCPSRTKPGRR
jgi:hypothetical protein